MAFVLHKCLASCQLRIMLASEVLDIWFKGHTTHAQWIKSCSGQVIVMGRDRIWTPTKVEPSIMLAGSCKTNPVSHFFSRIPQEKRWDVIICKMGSWVLTRSYEMWGFVVTGVREFCRICDLPTSMTAFPISCSSSSVASKPAFLRSSCDFGWFHPQEARVVFPGISQVLRAMLA